MDCYIKAVHRLINDESLDVETLAFLSNYSVTRCWVDKVAAKTFTVPVIYPSRYPNVDDIAQFYPGLQIERYEDFDSYYSSLQVRLHHGPAVTAVDRYHMDYIAPPRHMGAHYIFIEQINGDNITYLDFFDDNKHVMTVDTLRICTSEDNRVQNEGRILLTYDKRLSACRSLNDSDVQTVLMRRICYLDEALGYLTSFSKENVGERLVYRFFLKIALGGMLISDFYGKNGRWENYLFAKRINMRGNVLRFWCIAKSYAILGKVFFVLYRIGGLYRSFWRAYLALYRMIMRAEIKTFRQLAKRGFAITEHWK